MRQDAAEGAAAVGAAAHPVHHVTRDAVLVVGHLPVGPPAPQTEVEDGGDLTAAPGPGGEGAGEQGVEGLEEERGETRSLSAK